VESAVQQLRQLCSAAPSQSTERVGSARIECAMYNGVAVPTVALKPLPLNGERVDEALGVATLLCQALDAAAAHTRESGARPATIRGGALGHQLLGEARTVPDNGGVVGVLWDLFFCDNEKEAVVLAALLSTNLRTVVVHSAEHMTLWRNRLQSYEKSVGGGWFGRAAARIVLRLESDARLAQPSSTVARRDMLETLHSHSSSLSFQRAPQTTQAQLLVKMQIADRR
jgi:hypothetical protein